jgi:hypothetical protein
MKKKTQTNFYLGPTKTLNGKSIVSLLTNKIGIKQGKVKTLKTEFLSTNNKTFNKNDIKLQVLNEEVYIVLNNNDFYTSWSLDDIKKIVQFKTEKKLSKKSIEKMITEGNLQVKFIVSHIKNHGTMWKLKL